MNYLKSKLANALEYVHPAHLRALGRWKSAAERKAVRRGLRPQPASRPTKENCVRDHARHHQCRVMIETGTFKGHLIHALLRDFERIYSIELAHDLFAAAQLLFAGESHVTLFEGDSAGVLPGILAQLKEPAVFWLDAHASGDDTANGTMETPILSELTAILAHPVKSHVVLIDDAREFGMGKDYPTLRRVQKLTAGVYPRFEKKDDIIRITR